MSAVAKTLAGCPLFKGVAEDEIAALIEKSRPSLKTYDRNETIIHAGDETSSLGFIISGCLAIKKYLPTGGVVTVFHRQSGEMTGGYVVFAENPTAPYDIIATVKSQMLFVCKDSVVGVLFGNQTVAMNMMHIYANRVRQFGKRLEMFSYSSIQQKIACSLLNDFQVEKNSTVVLPFTKTAWAEYLNVSRPSLSRELKALAAHGLICAEKNKITVLDKVGLENLLFE